MVPSRPGIPHGALGHYVFLFEGHLGMEVTLENGQAGGSDGALVCLAQ